MGDIECATSINTQQLSNYTVPIIFVTHSQTAWDTNQFIILW